MWFSDVSLDGKIDGNRHLGHIMLECFRKRTSDDICQIDAAIDEKETYGSVLGRTVAMARSLRRAGFRPGDVMALGGRNHLNLRIPYYAAMMEGLPVGGIDTAFKYEKIKSALGVLRPKIAFCEYEHYEFYSRAAKELGLDTKIITFNEGEFPMAKFMEQSDTQMDEEYRPSCFDTDKVYAWLLCTSGTTGNLKFAALKHGAAVLAVQTLTRLMFGETTFRKLKAAAANQLMGSLPANRVNASRPFEKVGVDYAGPVSLRNSRVRRAVISKGYISVFVCFTTKAIHLELVSDLTTDAFLACFKRFISRRNLPSDVYSDNAKTFVGARNRLDDLYKLHASRVHQGQVQSFAAERGIRFHYIPAYSPVFGGLWEAAVKSTKYHLKRVVGKALLTYEQLNTVLAEIEAVLNSRPLTAMSADPTDFSYLTPGHFLTGAPLNAYPEKDCGRSPVCSQHPLMNIIVLQSSEVTSIDSYIDMINKYKPSKLISSPSVLSLILKHEKHSDLTCLDTVLVGGAKVYREFLRSLKASVHKDAKVIEAYGSSEIAIVIGTNANTPEGSGGASSGVNQFKLVDVTTGAEVTEPYKHGELWAKGPACFTEYYNNPEETVASMTQDGWFKTGDIVYRDEHQNFYFVDRLKMFIQYRNYRLIPPELEEVILNHPGVLEVCVTGVPHPDDGERPAACVVRRPGCGVTAQEIQDLIAETLSETKQLRGGVVFVDCLPKTSTGKVIRPKVQSLAKDLLEGSGVSTRTAEVLTS